MADELTLDDLRARAADLGIEGHEEMDQEALIVAIAALEGPDDPPELETLSRDELNDLARAAGINEPEKLQNKGAVIEALQAPTEPQTSGRPDLTTVAQQRAANRKSRVIETPKEA